MAVVRSCFTGRHEDDLENVIDDRAVMNRTDTIQGLEPGLQGFEGDGCEIRCPFRPRVAGLQRVGHHRLPTAGLMRLAPPAAALPILIGLTAGVYGCLAAMAVLPLSVEHMTLVTVFVLIAHSLPQEGIIQAKAGINFLKTTLVRLAAAVLTCLVVSWCSAAGCGTAAAFPPACGTFHPAAFAEVIDGSIPHQDPADHRRRDDPDRLMKATTW
jgi:hypothetical protein